ncbi:MAG: CHAT domain-containing protein [Symploca sp. SIO2D2]|nr:CHAT domain-containing protein [Symploca sp. SIO2D2]
MARKWRLLILRVQFSLLRAVRVYRNEQQTRRHGDVGTRKSVISRRVLLFILSALFGFTSALSLPALSAYQIAQEQETTSQNSDAWRLVKKAQELSETSELGEAQKKWLEAATSFFQEGCNQKDNILKSFIEMAEILRILGFDKIAFNNLFNGLQLYNSCEESNQLIQDESDYLNQSDVLEKDDLEERLKKVLKYETSSLTEAKALQGLGKVLRELGNFSESIEVLNKSLQYAQTPNSSLDLDTGAILLDIANTQVSAGREKINEQKSAEELIIELAKYAQPRDLTIDKLPDILTSIGRCNVDKDDHNQDICNSVIGGGYYQLAINFYKKVEETDSSATTQLKAKLNLLSLRLDISKSLNHAINKAKEIEPREQTEEKLISTRLQWDSKIKLELDEEVQNLIAQIDKEVSLQIDPKVALSKSNIDFLLKFTDLLTKNNNSQVIDEKIFSSLDFFPKIKEILGKNGNYVEKLKDIKDPIAKAFFLGNVGKINEQLKDYDQAYRLTEEALNIARIGEPKPYITYILSWQLGRILKAQGKLEEARKYYKLAFDNLEDLRKYIAENSRNLQFDFKEEFEPVYRDLVGLLLPEKSTAKKSIDKAQDATEDSDDIKQAINVLESLRIAELENYFQDPCFIEGQDEVDIAKWIDDNEQDSSSAIIYPIVLDEEENIRLVVLLKLPNQKIDYRSQIIPKLEFKQNIEELRRIIYTNSRSIVRRIESLQDRVLTLKTKKATREKTLHQPLQKLYDWLIKPIEADLQDFQEKTLVFVPDRELRNVPLVALHDGEKYLIEKYSIALLPGLKLTNAQPWSKKNPKVLLGGNEKQLSAAKRELKNIAMDFPKHVKLLIDDSTNNSTKKFTKKNLETELRSSFDIVHLATHGKFSPDLENTQIEIREIETEKGTKKEVIKFQEFEDLLQKRNSDPIKLLVLSSCETSTGNDRAVLGLAGVAVRTGASSTVATLWPVEDETAAEVMIKFYQELADNPSLTIAEALRQAQLKMLKEDIKYKSQGDEPIKADHPIFWAGYVVVGNWL